MPRTVHPAEWPDKVMFAAMLVVIAGALGSVFAVLRLAGLRIDRGLSDLLYITPPTLSLVLSGAMIVLGVFAIRHQAAIWVWLAIVAGILSMGMIGFVPLLSLVAIVFLVRSRLEGEETTLDERTVAPSVWADKALAASLLLFVGGLVSLFQAVLLFNDNMTAPMLAETPQVLAGASLVAGAWCVYASFEVYRLRRAWTGYVGVALAIVTLGFLALGPALAVGAFVLLQRARAENEFDDAAPTAAAS